MSEERKQNYIWLARADISQERPSVQEVGSAQSAKAGATQVIGNFLRHIVFDALAIGMTLAISLCAGIVGMSAVEELRSGAGQSVIISDLVQSPPH